MPETDRLESALADQDLEVTAAEAERLDTADLVSLIERLDKRRAALLFRLLPKDRALEVFERLDATLQSDLVHGLQDDDVAAVFAELDPDDRVGLIDELPAAVAHRLLLGLSDRERDLTSILMGYPVRSVGRRMSPEHVWAHVDDTVASTLERVRSRVDDAESVYTIPVVDHGRRVLGVLSLRQLVGAAAETAVTDLMRPADRVVATEDAEVAARRCADSKALALPVVDAEDRLVGLLTVDDALVVLELAESEDQARIGGSEPLRRPYLATPVASIVRSRIVWLLVLALGATLTVRVLETFESTLEQMVVLSVFIPLLIGTGGNTGNQAATTVTRAIALGDVRLRELGPVLWRELRVGLSLGALLGTAGFCVAGLIYDVEIGAVIGLTLAAICTLAAVVGGGMPLLAKALRVDPAVFSNPFISTFVDATGLIVYFLVARAVLGL